MSGQPPYGQPPLGPPQPPYGQPPFGPPQPPYGGPPGWQPRENAPGAVLSLVLGIVGIVLCQIAGPFAWAIGRRAEDAASAEPNRYTGKDMATAGKILGIIGTVLLALIVLFVVVVIIIAVADSSST